MVQNFIEFVLLKEQIQSKFALIEKRVNFLFDVQLKRSKEEDNLRCWVKVEGNEHDINRAKDYIIAVCSSCSPALSSLEEAVLNENNNTSHFTKQTPSVVGINNHECDRDLFIHQDTAPSETLTQEKLILKDPTSEHISQFQDLTVDGQECANAANDKSLPVSSENMVIQTEGSIGRDGKGKLEIATKARVPDRPHEASDESLRDFALKLGYGDSTISAGLRKLGASANKNSLLSELVKAQSSVKQLEEGSSTFCYEKHRDHPSPEDSNCLRPIVIDGSNVAMSHGTQKVFSCRGIGIAVDWFLKRNHRNIKVFVPMWRAKSSRPDSPIREQEVLKRLEEDGILVWTPSRQSTNGRLIKCYDDRYIIKHAAENDGVIVSNDNFRDLMGESHEWKKVIEQRVLMYTFVDDKFMPPDDPMGRHGPTLGEFLKKGCGKLCPYERNCTYGNRCKYLHPERNPVKLEQDTLPPSSDRFPPDVPYGQVTRPSRPLPPCPPDIPQHTRPVPPAPLEYHKPLPLPPQGEFPAQMARAFPPTLRTGQAVGIGERRSDPLPYHTELPPDVQLMQEQFERTLSTPSFQDQACGGVPSSAMVRRGSLPHVPAYHASPYSPGPQEIMARGGLMTLRRMPSDSTMVNGDWMLQQDQCMFSRPGFQHYPTHFPANPPVSGPSSHQHPPVPQNHWGIPPYPPEHPQYPPPQPQYHYSHSPFNSGYGRAPYHGQRNGYFRSRAPPIIDGWCGDVTDNPKDGESSVDFDKEKLRIEAYEKLCEVFPDNVEKILTILDKYSDETRVETLTQHMLDDADS